MKTIESIQNKIIKERSKLSLKKERDKSSLFLVEGKHMIEEALQAGCLKELYILMGENNPFSFEAIYCTQAVLNKLSNQNSDAKMIGVCTKPKYEDKEFSRILLLDTVQDPGNFGTIVRTAHSFGFDAIFYSKGCADIFNLKTIQSSQGAFFHIPVIQADLREKIPTLQKQGISIFATALHEKSIFLQEVVIPERYGIVLGNEGQGIAKDIIALCEHCLKIEMDTFESLNVGIAASICMYHFRYTRKEV
ncbi:MAG: RNA methyltransferase [Bacillota bacterium]|nr:RNA methyltransferase [Bacillota bacterium]